MWNKYLVVIATMLVAAGSARAATFEAELAADAHDAAAGDGICADTNGACSLRAAVEEANASAGHDVVQLRLGTYILDLGQLEVTDHLDLLGAGIGTVINAKRLSRVLYVDNPSVELTISNLELLNGRTQEAGGIIYNGGVLTVTDARLKGGKAGRGSGIFNSGTMTLRRVGLARHTDAPPAGLGGAIANSGSAVLDSVTIVRGQARLGCGGGIYNTGTITATNLYVARNRARLGFAGGICNAGGTIDCTNCLIARNQAQQLTGGIRNDGTMRLWNSVVSDNFFHKGVVGRVNDPNCSGTAIVSKGYNVEDRNSCGFNQTTDLFDAVVRLRGPSPIKGTFLYAGRPRDGSVLVDRADNAVCPDHDLIGNPRPVDGDGDGAGVCDVGPFELIP